VVIVALVSRVMAIHIHKETECNAPRAKVFAYVDDYRNVPDWLYGISKFVPTTEKDRGFGAIFEGSINLGATLHSTIEVVAYDEGTMFEFDSIKGFKNSSKWTFEDVDANTTRIIADVSYELPGGIAGKALGKVIEPFVKIAVKHSSDALAKHAAA
jgi:uncharacterized membrane protein